MTDSTTTATSDPTDPAYDPVLDPTKQDPATAAPQYPDTPSGMLQQQLDQLTAEAAATRATAAQYTARADAADARAALVQAAIDSLGAAS